jgi:hypothetical protein
MKGEFLMSKKALPAGTWVRQVLNENQVRIFFIPTWRKKKIQFFLYDNGDIKKNEGWRYIFKDHPEVEIDRGVVTMRFDADIKNAHVTWFPDDPEKELVEIMHPIPQSGAGITQGVVSYLACLSTVGLANPAVAIALCSPALLISA